MDAILDKFGFSGRPAHRQEDSANQRAWLFGPFTLNLDRGTLLRDGREVRLRPKSFAVLTYLVEHSGDLATKEELLEAVWGHAYITEGSLNQCLRDIRRALGDCGQSMIRTVPKRGVILEAPVTRRAGSRRDATKVPDFHVGQPWRTAAGLVVLLLVTGWWGLGRLGVDVPLSARIGPAAPENSIAVLPFLDLSPKQDHEYFSDGLSEEILNSLTQIPGLRVTARTSSFSFKGKSSDIATVAEKLNVAHVLEGSVRKSGNVVRITAQLVDANTGDHLWSKTWQREVDDVFGVQVAIAKMVADSLQLTLSERGVGTIAAPHDPRAYEHYLQGRYFYKRRGEDDIERALSHYLKAVEIDPAFARPWVGLAAAYGILMFHRELSAEEGLAKQRSALDRALALNPNLAEAHARISSIYFLTGQRQKAVAHRAKAVSLGTNDATMLALRAGWNMWRGHYREGIALQRKRVALDPLAAVGRTNLASYLRSVGRFDEGAAEIREALALRPGSAADVNLILTWLLVHQQRFEVALPKIEAWPRSADRAQGLAMVYHALGRGEDAEAATQRLAQYPGGDSAFRLAEVYAQRGEPDATFRQLARIGGRALAFERNRVGANWTNGLRLSPFLLPLRDDPRWEHAIAQANQWDRKGWADLDITQPLKDPDKILEAAELRVGRPLTKTSSPGRGRARPLQGLVTFWY